MSLIRGIKSAFIVFLLAYSVFLIIGTLRYLKLRKLFTFNIKRLKHGLILINDLHENLTPWEFKNWCGDFLEKQGYLDLLVIPKGSDCGKDIICTKNKQTYYVLCKRYIYGLNAKFKVDEDAVKNLIGSMAMDNINNGIIITSGTFSYEAIKYLKTLPSKYNFELYEGKDLVKEYEVLRTLEIHHKKI